MNYSYKISYSGSTTYVQEFLNGKKIDGRFISINMIINKVKPHRNYKALKNRIERWLKENHPELLI